MFEKTICLVASNKQITKNISSQIDECDLVFRFNHLQNFNGIFGSKIDYHIFRGNGAKRFSGLDKRQRLPVFYNKNTKYIKIIEGVGKDLSFPISDEIYPFVDGYPKKITPSSGFIVLDWILNNSEFDEYKIILCGWTFKGRWKHGYKYEKNFCEAEMKCGRISFMLV